MRGLCNGDKTILESAHIVFTRECTVKDLFYKPAIVDIPVPDNRGDDGIRRYLRHIHVKAYASYPGVSGGALGGKCIAVLGNDVAIFVYEIFGCDGFGKGVEPGACDIKIYGGIRINRGNSHGKGRDEG